MSTEATVPTESKKLVWAGRILSALPVPLLLLSAGMKLMGAPVAVEGFAKQGFPPNAVIGIGITELVITILYVIPQTAVLGAILLTGYLGGAIVTHLRLSEPYIVPIIMGVVLWLGLYLRDRRLRALLPLRGLMIAFILGVGNF